MTNQITIGEKIINQNNKTPAGTLSRYFCNWERFLSNSFVLNIVRSGYKIQLNHKNVFIHKMITIPSKSKRPLILKEIEKHLSSGVISKITPLNSDIVSRIFSVPKPNGKLRIIIDLSYLNKFIRKISFKMEEKNAIKSIIGKNDFMVSIDLKDAFSTISLHPDSRRYTCFELDGVRYCYNTLPFGLTSSPRVFTKVFKPVISHLRTRGIKITSYLDDILLSNVSFESL